MVFNLGGAGVDKTTKAQFLRHCLIDCSDVLFSDEITLLFRLYMDIIERYENSWGCSILKRSASEIDTMIHTEAQLIDTSECCEQFSEFDIEVSFTKAVVMYMNWNKATGICKAIGPTMYGLRLMTTVHFCLSLVNSPEHLQKLLNDKLDPESDGTADCRTRGIAWLAYSGLTPSEVFGLRSGDLDIDGKTVTVIRDSKPVKVSLPRLAIPSLSFLASSNSFSYVHPNYGRTSKRRMDGDLLVRGADTSMSSKEAYSTTSGHKKLLTSVFRKWRMDKLSAREMRFYSLFVDGAYYRAELQEQSLCRADVAPETLDAIRLALRQIQNGELGYETLRSEDSQRILRWRISKDYRLWKRYRKMR